MVRFLSRLALLATIMLMIIIGMHAVAIWNMRDSMESIYTLDPSTEVLFLGSSQVGCSIDEDEDHIYHLRKLWVSDTIVPSCLMRLKELERRKQVDHLKMVVVPFNLHSVISQSERGYLWGWYQELPISWRYLDMLPYGRWKFAWYILCNLRFPFHMHLSDKPPERKCLAGQPEKYMNKVLLEFRQAAQKAIVRGSSPEWEKRLFDAYREMGDICKRHGVRFVVYKAPLLPEFERNLSGNAQEQIAAFEKKLYDMDIEYVKPQVGLDESHFFDDVHLITTGSKVFTAELFRELNRSKNTR